MGISPPSHSITFQSIGSELSAASASFAEAGVKTVLILGEKLALAADNIPLAALALPSDFLAPIADGSTESVTTFVAGKAVTIAVFTDKRSRNLGPVRADAIHDVVAKSSGKDGDLVILLRLANSSQVLPAATAIARAFPIYVKKSKPAPVRVVHVHIVLAQAPATPVDVAEIQIVATAARDCAYLVDMPPNELNPTTYVDFIHNVWKNQLEAHGVTMTVIKDEALKDHGYGGIYAVGKASQTPPALVILSHTTVNATKTVAWVGKGITFDTGGLSLKVGGVMSNMKTDMGGSGGVFQAFVATILNKVNTNFNLHAILCIAENSVDERSYRVDDVITSYSGKTVEVLNTDAEGRLVLMDGVAHACKHLDPDVLVDMATLTGAQTYATGAKHAAFVSNNAEFEGLVHRAGLASGDLAYPLVYCPEFLAVDKVMTSKVADMTNIPGSAGDRTNAPSASSGLFVAAHLSPEEKWTEEGEGWWAHIDMAFPSNAGGRATGYGVAILYTIAQSLNAKFSA